MGFFQFTLQFFWGIEKAFSFWVRYITPLFSGASFGDAVANYPSLLVNISGVTVMRLSAFFPDPHMCSFYLGMAVPFGLLLFCEKQGRKRFVYGALALFIFIADLLTFSRGGYIGLVSGGIAFLFLQPNRIRKSFSPLLIGIFLPALLIGIILSPVGERLWSSASLKDGSNVERLRLWQEASVSIRENPILGTGIGNYSLSVKPTTTYREPIYVHNLFLDIAVEIGVFGALSFFALLFLALIRSYTAFMKAGSLEQGVVFVSLMIFLGHSLFETPLFSVHILPVLLFLLALSLSYRSSFEKV
ncbi:MAG: O-antigen ligase family protein [Patescibacteria group bacterium]